MTHKSCFRVFRLLWRGAFAALALAISPLLAPDPSANPNATLVYYNLAGNQTLDPADPQNNSS